MDSVYLGENKIIKIFLGNSVLNDFNEKIDDVYNLDSVTYTGSWEDSSLTGYDGSTTKYSTNIDATATWSFYGKSSSNYNVYVWYPISSTDNTTQADYSITTVDGYWKTSINQNEDVGTWKKIATVRITEGTVVEISLIVTTNTNTRVNAIRMESTTEECTPQYDSSSNQDTTTVLIAGNQSGYDVNKTKRATVTNVEDGTEFQVIRIADNSVMFTGTVEGQIADFTSINITNSDDTYKIKCKEVESYEFKIKDNYIQEISLLPALRFMDESRQDTFNVGGNTGYGWRDSHQFSFEVNSLVLQYMSNPSYYKSLTHKISHVDTCEYEELRTQTEPSIIWLIKFGVLRYYDWAKNKGIKLHALIKGQLAYFLYLYPHITEYVSREFYEGIRDITIEQWGISECNKAWYEVDDGIDNSLFVTQNKIGTIKGQLPPGYAIIPNLLMWEVAKRDGLSDADNYFNAFTNNCKWLVNSVDLDDPANTKGQRMSEYITITSLCQAYELYPNLCPTGTYEKIERAADVFISRSNNIWDLRQYSTKDDITGSTKTIWTGGGTMNEPGNIAGFPSVCYAMARILTDGSKVNRLKELAISHIDQMFGRNPFGRHFGYDAITEIEGVDLGWFKKYQGGYGDLGSVFGRIDGSPKESAYPFNPNADCGYTEGWVAFNTAWNTSLAYLCGENSNITDGLWIFSKNN